MIDNGWEEEQDGPIGSILLLYNLTKWSYMTKHSYKPYCSSSHYDCLVIKLICSVYWKETLDLHFHRTNLGASFIKLQLQTRMCHSSKNGLKIIAWDPRRKEDWKYLWKANFHIECKGLRDWEAREVVNEEVMICLVEWICCRYNYKGRC